MTELLALIAKITDAGHSVVIAPGYGGNAVVGLRVNSDNRNLIQAGLAPDALLSPDQVTYHLEALWQATEQGSAVRLGDGCIGGHHPDLVSCSLGADWP